MESAVILAGGKSRRMGRNKALMDFGGEVLIRRVYRMLKDEFDEVLISANDGGAYDFLGAPVIRDTFEAGGSLAGIHAGLSHSSSESIFVAACDMPFLNVDLVRFLGSFADDYDVVVPVNPKGFEPLHAFYSKNCLPHIERQMDEGNLKVLDFYDKVRTREIRPEEMREHDPDNLSPFNINTQEKFELALAKLEEMKGA
jgi:molybdopterin-guanine dinucleotide biosynthesis protein A